MPVSFDVEFEASKYHKEYYDLNALQLLRLSAKSKGVPKKPTRKERVLSFLGAILLLLGVFLAIPGLIFLIPALWMLNKAWLNHKT